MTKPALSALIHHLRSVAEKAGEARLSDRQLLQRYLTYRDEAAFTALVRRHGPLVLSACRRILSEESDVEDAFQATFLVLLRKASSVRWQTSMGSWLFGVAHRIALKARTRALRRRRHETEANRLHPRQEDKTADLSWREALRLLHEELDRLPDKYRLPLLLCYLDGKTREEAAQVIGCSVTSIKGRLERGREMLRMRLTRRGVTLSGALLAALVDAPAATSVAPALIQATQGAARTGIHRASVTALMKAAIPAVWMGKARLVAGALLTIYLLTVGGELPRTGPETPTAKPTERRQPPPYAVQAKTKESVLIRGRVLGPDGKPIKGARLYSARVSSMFPHDDAVVALAQKEPTGAEGRFHVRIQKPKIEEYVYVIAHAAGFGVDWIDLNEADLPSEVMLRLVKDVPITGRVVNTEGRPVAGVSVSVTTIAVPSNGKLDDYLNGWHRGLLKVLDTLNTPRKRLYVSLDAISGAATTDKDGRFTLRGAGAERIVHVTFSGGGIARTTPFVITRPGFDAKPYNDVLQSDKDVRMFVKWNRFFGLYPPDFTLVAEIGKAMEGTVKDMDTGKPLAGCRVITDTSYGHEITAITNAEGKYRLEGLARTHGYGVWVGPPKCSAYLYGRAGRVANTPDFTTIRQDFQLAKGAIVSGRVVDKQTGKGVHCHVSSFPLPENKFFGSKKFFTFGGIDTSREIEAGEDGRFRLVTIPGRALLVVGTHGERFHGERLCVYRQAVPDADHKNIFKRAADSWTVATAGNRSQFLSIYNAVKVIEVKENGETRVEISVDPGAMARIAVQDTDGKPLAGAWAAGLTHSWPMTYKLPEATATVYALDPATPRTMAFLHAEKKLGGTATVRGDEKEPVVVKLAPVGKLSGRLLDLEGNPLKGVEVSINAETGIGSELYRFAAPTGKPVYTDEHGRFRIEGIVPDLKFRLNLRKERTFFDGEPRIGYKQIKPSEALDLGDVRVKALR